MKIYENGIYRDLTDEELSAMEQAQEEAYTAFKSADMTDAEKLELLLSTMTEDKTNKGDNGEVLTTATIQDNKIVYIDNGYRLGTGTYDDPKQFVDGDTVEAGKYYCRCKVSDKGTVYRQLASATYKALNDCTPTWGDTNFELAY